MSHLPCHANPLGCSMTTNGHVSEVCIIGNWNCKKSSQFVAVVMMGWWL
uniref:Uncharacterized protein n=1 Tax=Setaria italica TaxID=4555 RepID=K3Z271_SETIT